MQKLPVLLLLLTVFNEEGDAFCVRNQYGYEAAVRIDGIFKDVVGPGGAACCHWKECGGSADKVLSLWITTAPSLTHFIQSQAGGCIYINKDKTKWNWPESSRHDDIIQSVSYKIDPARPGECTWEEFSAEPYVNTRGSRRVHFLATADPQYSIPYKTKDVPDRTIATMRKVLDANWNLRGMIVAGDLVQWADYWFGNFIAYTTAFEGKMRYLFDGVGNHDVDGKEGWSSSVSNILDHIRRRNRVTATDKLLMTGRPDYSWNWDDVHFVQMNVHPSDSTHGLEGLKLDLEYNVGTSGNPIVMIHHYGFDGFSRQPRWWTDAQRKKYWDIIKGYNVIAIITGHLHNANDILPLLTYWEGDDYLNGTKIPYFIAGAAMQDGCNGRGCFLEFNITESRLTVTRHFGDDATDESRASIPIKSTKKKPLATEGVQVVFENIPRDGSILTIYPNPAINELHIDVQMPNKGKLIEGVEMYDRNEKLFDVPALYPANQLNFSISQLPPLNFYLLRIKIAGGRIEQRKFWKHGGGKTK